MASGSGCASIWTSGPPTVQLYVADSVCRCFRRSAYCSNCAAERWPSAGVGRLSHPRPADPSPDAARSPRQASSGSRRRASAPRVGLDGRSAPGPTPVTTSSSASATATNTSPANSASPRHWTRPRRAWPEVPGPGQVSASEQPGPAPPATPSARRAGFRPPGRGRGGPEVHPRPGPLRPGPGLLPRPEASRNSQIDEDDARIDPPELSLPWRRGTAARSCQSVVKAAAGFGTLVARARTDRPAA
jgi:hypothetical protein